MTAARFDGTSIWNGLSSEATEQIGSLALELVAAWHCRERAFEDANVFGDRAPPLLRAAEASEQLVIELLKQAFAETDAVDAVNDPTGFPLLPVSLGQVCRVCGCSEMDACQPFSCSWVEPDLCSACAASTEAGATS